MYDIDSYKYDLPEDLIAQNPAEPRDQSRLLTLDSRTGQVEHRIFREFPKMLTKGDLLVLNDTRVFMARLEGRKKNGTARIEILLLSPVDPAEKKWKALVRPGRRLPPGSRVLLAADDVCLEIQETSDHGIRTVEFPEGVDARDIMRRFGSVPLPPYIRSTSAHPSRYQTVYSRNEGSAAAPTAGLHFTKRLLGEIEAAGVRKTSLTLHVGIGTFRPVKVNDIRDHMMHEESGFLSRETVEAVDRTRSKGNRVIAVGTTTVRALESVFAEKGRLEPGPFVANTFIYPGYSLRTIDAMLTNFHLPGSTLLMLVAAFGGYDNVMNAYRTAVLRRYRFFSFGDAMFIYQ